MKIKQDAAEYGLKQYQNIYREEIKKLTGIGNQNKSSANLLEGNRISKINKSC